MKKETTIDLVSNINNVIHTTEIYISRPQVQ